MCKTVDEARDLVAAARSKGTPLQIGHIERFNPAIVAIRPRIEEPRFITCDRISPFSFRSADVGVVLDLMIHDLDIVLDFCGSPVVDVEATGVNVIAKHEDIAHARLKFASGGLAVLTASRVSIKKMRASTWRLATSPRKSTPQYVAAKSNVSLTNANAVCWVVLAEQVAQPAAVGNPAAVAVINGQSPNLRV